jgi:hypothetical protein
MQFRGGTYFSGIMYSSLKRRHYNKLSLSRASLPVGCDVSVAYRTIDLICFCVLVVCSLYDLEGMSEPVVANNVISP